MGPQAMWEGLKESSLPPAKSLNGGGLDGNSLKSET